MAAEQEALAAGQAWLLARLEAGAHPLDGLDPEAARATIDDLTGLEPEAWTGAWGPLADDFAARARAASDRAKQRELWFQAYRAAFMGRYPVPNHPLKEQLYARAREFFLRKAIGWALRDYAKAEPERVRQYVAEHPELSGLSRREALKHLGD